MSHLDCIKKTPEKNIGPLSKVQSFLISKYTFMKMGEKKCAWNMDGDAWTSSLGEMWTMMDEIYNVR